MKCSGYSIIYRNDSGSAGSVIHTARRAPCSTIDSAGVLAWVVSSTQHTLRHAWNRSNFHLPLVKLCAHLVHAEILHRPVQLLPAGGDGLLGLNRLDRLLQLLPGVVFEVVGELGLNLSSGSGSGRKWGKLRRDVHLCYYCCGMHICDIILTCRACVLEPAT